MPDLSGGPRRVLLASLITMAIGFSALAVLARPTEAPEVSVAQPVEPLGSLKVAPDAHPRLFFGAGDVPELRNRALTSHRDIWEPILAFARGQAAAGPPLPPQPGDLDGYRNAGNRVIAYAFAYVITNDQEYLDLTRRHLLAYAAWNDWGDENGPDERDLGFHHMLLGNALAYDWVFNELTDADRATIGPNLARRAEESYQASSSVETRWGNWWRRAYTQNHHWTNHSALGVAALVLEGGDERASRWLEAAMENVSRDVSLLEGIGDGTWHEGITYQSYGLTMSLPFLDNLRRLHGRDLIPHRYLQNYVYWRVYNSLAGSARFLMAFGDLEWEWANSYNPEGLLRFAAREYQSGLAEWVAHRAIDRQPRSKDVYGAPWYVFEFLYYDPAVAPQLPDGLFPNRTFPDLEGVIWRTGWGESDLVFGMKAGAPGGRHAFDSFVNGEKAPFDPTSRVDVYHAGHDHDDANTFYLYRGGIDLASERVGYQLTDTEYHNTLLVDGQGQYRAFTNDPDLDGLPERVRGTDGRLEVVLGSKDFSYLVADATRRYRSAPSPEQPSGKPLLQEFKRHVIFVKPGYLVMVDNVRAEVPHQYDWISHFGRSVQVEGDWVHGLADRNQVLGVKIVAPGGFTADTGDDGKPYVRVRPARPVASTRFAMLLWPTDRAGWAARPVVTSLGESDNALGVRVEQDGAQDHLIRYGSRGAVQVGEYSLDGAVASIIRDESGEPRRVFLGQGTRLSDRGGGRLLVRSARTIVALQIDREGAAMEVWAENLGEVEIYAPWTDLSQVRLNGAVVAAEKDGEYILLRAAP